MTTRFAITLGMCCLYAIPGLTQSLSKKNHTAILDVFYAQEAAWNAGDIDTFMEGYWNNDSLAFIGGSGISYGWQTTRDNYKRRYPDRASMGKLNFTLLHIKKLGPKSAHITGKWHLTREMGDVGGYFTLVWRKIGGQWLIVSDHTSSS